MERLTLSNPDGTIQSCMFLKLSPDSAAIETNTYHSASIPGHRIGDAAVVRNWRCCDEQIRRIVFSDPGFDDL